MTAAGRQCCCRRSATSSASWMAMRIFRPLRSNRPCWKSCGSAATGLRRTFSSSLGKTWRRSTPCFESETFRISLSKQSRRSRVNSNVSKRAPANDLPGEKNNMTRVFRGKLFLFFAIAITVVGHTVRAQDRSQGRSMVISRGGIVAAESPLAAQAGVRILEHGGNAVDAAIATNAMMGVVSPMMNGIGGDLFVIVYDAKANKLYGLNASGWAPKNLTPELLKKKGLREMPQTGVNTITVPGAVDGWQKLADKFGRKKLSEDLAPAIQTARAGYPVTEWVAMYWNGATDYLRGDDAAAKLYLAQDHAPKTGDIFTNPDLAWSLQQIAVHGRDAFYKGEISKKYLIPSSATV